MQFIFLLESDSKSQSDYFYISWVIDKLYCPRQGEHKFSPVFMKGKGNFNKFEQKVKQICSKYKGKSEVFYCIDLDKEGTSSFLMNKVIEKHVKAKGAHLIWFNEDIEQVFIGHSVTKSEKTNAAKHFLQAKAVDIEKLTKESRKQKSTSNILCVLDQFLKRR